MANRSFRFVPTTKNTDTLWYALADYGRLVATVPEDHPPDFMELFG